MKCRILTPSIQCSQCSVNTEGGMLKCDACDPGFQLRGNICFKDESPKGFVSIVVRFGMRKVKRVMILRHAIRLTMGRVNVSAVQKAVCVQNVMMVSSYFLGVAILRIKRTS